MDHPPFVPAGLIINDEEPGDISEHVNERTGVVGISRQTGLGFQYHPNSADGGQVAVGSSRGRCDAVIEAWYGGGKDVGLKAGGIQQVVLEKLARAVGLRKDGQRQVGMRPPREFDEPRCKRGGQKANVTAMSDFLLIASA